MTAKLLTVSWRNVAGYDGREHLVQPGKNMVTLCGHDVPDSALKNRVTMDDICHWCLSQFKKGAVALEEGK